MKIECDEELFLNAFKDAFEEYFKSGKFDPPYIFYDTLAPSFTKIMQKVVDRLSYLEDRIEKLENTKN